MPYDIIRIHSKFRREMEAMAHAKVILAFGVAARNIFLCSDRYYRYEGKVVTVRVLDCKVNIFMVHGVSGESERFVVFANHPEHAEFYANASQRRTWDVAVNIAVALSGNL